jgi:hypothetical protein
MSQSMRPTRRIYMTPNVGETPQQHQQRIAGFLAREQACSKWTAEELELSYQYARTAFSWFKGAFRQTGSDANLQLLRLAARDLFELSLIREERSRGRARTARSALSRAASFKVGTPSVPPGSTLH